MKTQPVGAPRAEAAHANARGRGRADFTRHLVIAYCDAIDLRRGETVCYDFWRDMASTVHPPAPDPDDPSTPWADPGTPPNCEEFLRGYVMGAWVWADIGCNEEQRRTFWDRMLEVQMRHIYIGPQGGMRFRQEN